jgi:hypothetical protein
MPAPRKRTPRSLTPPPQWRKKTDKGGIFLRCARPGLQVALQALRRRETERWAAFPAAPAACQEAGTDQMAHDAPMAGCDPRHPRETTRDVRDPRRSDAETPRRQPPVKSMFKDAAEIVRGHRVITESNAEVLAGDILNIGNDEGNRQNVIVSAARCPRSSGYNQRTHKGEEVMAEQDMIELLTTALDQKRDIDRDNIAKMNMVNYDRWLVDSIALLFERQRRKS